MRRLPPLNSLRAFEAVGRHLSMSAAAAELHVTPAAVSQQVKALEDFLGIRLLVRRHRAVDLTEAGRQCLPGLNDGFDALAAAVARIDTSRARNILTVSVTPAFGSRWLVPRIERFTATHPGITVHVDASNARVDLNAGTADVAIRYGSGSYEPLVAVKLFDEVVVPVCSPRLMEGERALELPGDLVRHVLIHDESLQFDPASPTWLMWLKAAGVVGVDADSGIRFSSADHAIQAAVDGTGVLLTKRSLAGTDLAAGRLVIPFATAAPVDKTYHLLCTRAALGDDKVAAFRNWIMAELEIG